MAIPNIFDNELWSLTSLTAAINNLPYQPTRLADLGLFEEEGINTLDVFIEEANGVLMLVDVKPRGAPGKPVTEGKGKGRPFRVPHIPQEGQVLADEIIGVREFGTENQQRTLESVRDRKLAIAKRNLDYTIENHRLAALMGQYINANGAAESLFTTFGVQQTTVFMDLSTSGTDQQGKHLQVVEAVEDALGGIPFTGLRGLCGKQFWRDYINNDDIKSTYLNTPMAAELRADMRQAREFGGIVSERYRGTSAVKIPDDEAYVFPVGVPQFAITRFAPGDFVEAIGTLGLPYYAVPEMLDYGKGMKFLAQSNPLNLITRPAAVIKLKRGTS